MEEIIDLVFYEIKNSGYQKKLIGGIVVTGGGAQLQHLTQLFEYMTGMDTRIGYPNEHLANTNNLTELASPIYSTGIGLVMKGFETAKESVKMSDTQDEVVTGHSDPEKRGGFFDKILKSTRDFTRDFFNDDNN
jgi:cell division protein FtsA